MQDSVPSGWKLTHLSDLIVFVIGGDWGKPPDYEDDNYVRVRCIRASEMKRWAEDRGATAALRKIKRSSLESRELRSGDIILEISGGGPEQPVGRTVLIDRSCLAVDAYTPKICTNFFRLVRPSQEIDSEYLNKYLQHFHAGPQIKQYQGGSNNLRNLKFQDYLTIQVPVPPLAEQRRIVAKIEELFSELDKGVESLKAARYQLKTYRQSLLKTAFEGRLTEQWRRDNADSVETADQVLQRIRYERETRLQRRVEAWRSAMTDCEGDGKHGGKAKTRKPRSNFDFMPTPHTGGADFPSIDREWAEIGSLADVSGGITKNQKRHSFPVNKPFLRVANVYANELRLDDMHSIGVTPDEIQNVTLEPGDLLVVEGNGSVDQLGRVAVWDGSIPECVHQNHLIKVRPTESMISKYIMWFLLSTHGRTCIKGVASSTSGLHTLSISKVQKLPIPLCSTREQEEIVAQIEAGLTQVAHLEETIGYSLARAESLRQSILKQAFEGRLVPQDADDEPASALLERIRVEQDKERKSTKGRRKANA